MYLSELFDHLMYGELGQLYIGGAESGSIARKDYAGLVSHINLGLLEIYKRFDLKTETCTVQQMPQFTNYKLDARYAKSNPYNTDDWHYPKYIIDSEVYPFQDDVLMIEAVEDELGEWYAINDETNPNAIMTTGSNIINTPTPSMERALFVYYRAKPEKVVINKDLTPDQVYVECPSQFVDALLSYVAHRVYAGRNPASPEAQVYFQKFSAALQIIEQNGLFNKDSLYNNRLEKQGWQ